MQECCLNSEKPTLSKRNFENFLFTRCNNNIVSIALNQISFDWQGFRHGYGMKEILFFTPCTSHLCKFLAELTFEDHPSVWSSDHMDSNISTLTFIQLITNSERIWDYSASVDNSFREWEFKRWEFEFNAVREGKRREEKKRFKLHCESEQIIVQTWIIRSFTLAWLFGRNCVHDSEWKAIFEWRSPVFCCPCNSPSDDAFNALILRTRNGFKMF